MDKSYSADISTIIREYRIKCGFTQQYLAEGICSTRHLIRIEKHEQVPRADIAEKLLQKLGVDFYKKTDLDSIRLHQDIEEIIILISSGHYEDLIERYNTLRDREYFDDTDIYVKQFCLTCEAVLLFRIESKPEHANKLIINALSLTIPSFAINNISKYYISGNEYIAINQMALINAEIGNIEPAIYIWRQLKASILSHMMPLTFKSDTLPAIASHLSKYLCINGLYEEALNECEDGIEYCRKGKQYRCIGDLYFNKAHCCISLGDSQSADECFECAYVWAKMTGDIIKSEEIKKGL